jgi:mannonate dehydratase
MSLISENVSSLYHSELIYEDRGGSVESLKNIPLGDVWTEDEIKVTKFRLFDEGREWRIVDNLPLHEEIKRNGTYRDVYIENYQKSIFNLAKNGINVICYNFTPVYHKLRTHFSPVYNDKYARSLFDPVAFAVFDLFILNRPLGENEYNGYQIHKAQLLNNRLSDLQRLELTENIFQGIQSVDHRSLDQLNELIGAYSTISDEELSCNLEYFKSKVVPIAEELGIKFHLHVDDPFGKLFGLPAVLAKG